MQFYVPSIGDQIRLLENWQLRLFAESRNTDFITRILGYGNVASTCWEAGNKLVDDLKSVNYDIDKLPKKSLVTVRRGSSQYRGGWGANGDYIVGVLPRGLVLTINRIYIRQGKSDYDSITFSVPQKLNNEFKGVYGRFWAKLSDVNRLQFEKFVPGKNSWVSSVYDEYGEEEFNFLEL